MRHSSIGTSVLFLFLMGAATDSAWSADELECAKTQCESRGRTCIQTLYATFDACMKAANKKCNAVQLAEKFNCLKTELKPCALSRNERQEACLADMQTCHAACGPVAEQRTHYWCVGEFENAVLAGFCATDAQSDGQMEQCEKAIGSNGQQAGAMSCEML